MLTERLIAIFVRPPLRPRLEAEVGPWTTRFSQRLVRLQHRYLMIPMDDTFAFIKPRYKVRSVLSYRTWFKGR